MKKRILFFSCIACIVFAFTFNVNACHIESIELNADCEGYCISGVVVSSYIYHPYTTLVYSLSLNGVAAASGQMILETNPASDLVPFEKCGSWGEVPCGDVLVEGTASLYYYWGDLADSANLGPITLSCPCYEGCTRTPGYWKQDHKPWPVDEVTICAITYTREEADAFLEMSVENDKTITMFKALVAAKLNVLTGTSDECIADIIAAADQWMCDYGPVGIGVAAGTDDSPWRSGEALYMELDKYNNGLLCVPECE